MNDAKTMVRTGGLLALILLMTGCVVEPADGYYDHNRHRYYHDHGWRECGERNDYCH